MAPVVLYRGPFTDLLLAILGSLNKPVGDGVIPIGAAWQGEPNQSVFVPFMVLSTLTASRSGGPIADPQADWLLPYLVQSFGATRSQCEWMADHARQVLAGLEQEIITLDVHTYLVQQIRVDSIGGVNRNDVTDPPTWGMQEQVTAWLSKAS